MMKKLIIKLLILTLVIPVVCSAATDSKRVVLSKAVFEAGKPNVTFNIEKFKLQDSIGIVIKNTKGEKVYEMNNLGQEDKSFTLYDKAKTLAVKDITGDGVPEIIVSAYYGPASALYVFKYDSKKASFSPMKFIDNPDVSMCRDFMVSDIFMSDGSDLSVLAGNKLRTLGKIYPSTPLGKTLKGYYYFKANGDTFKLTKTVPLS